MHSARFGQDALVLYVSKSTISDLLLEERWRRQAWLLKLERHTQVC